MDDLEYVLPAAMNQILGDYARNVPDARWGQSLGAAEIDRAPLAMHA